MRIINLKAIAATALLFLATGLHCISSEAAVAVETEIVSGTIIQILGDQSIKLDNGQIYLPSRKGLMDNPRKGALITLRYTTKNDGTKIFFEFAQGLHSLENQASPLLNRNRKKVN